MTKTVLLSKIEKTDAGVKSLVDDGKLDASRAGLAFEIVLTHILKNETLEI